MKLIIYLVLLLIYSCSSISSQDKLNINCTPNNRPALFNNTLCLIKEYSKKEYTGVVNDSIANNVFNLVYNKANVTLDEKIDILNLMIFFNEYATRSYRNKVFHKLEKNNTSVIGNFYLLYPLSFCHYCNSNLNLLKTKINLRHDKIKKLNICNSNKNYLLKLRNKIDLYIPVKGKKSNGNIIYFNEFKKNIRERLKKEYPKFNW